MVPGSTGWTGSNCAAACQANATCYAWWHNGGCRFYNNATTGFSANSGIAGVAAGELCRSSSPTRTPSPSGSPTLIPCSAPPGYFCRGGAALVCPIGAYCAGGAALNVSCYPATACSVAGLSAQPACFWNVSSLAGSGAVGSVNGIGSMALFSRPVAVAVNAQSIVYVADSSNNLIRLIYPNQSVITFAGKGTASASDGTGPAAGFSGPNGLDVDQNSVLYVADMNNNLIRTVSPSGDVRTIIGSTPGSANGFGAAAKLNHPATLAVLPDGNLIICDRTTT